MGLTEYDADNVVKALRKWEPPKKKITSEKTCQKELLKHLRATFPNDVFRQQHAVARTFVDIMAELEGDDFQGGTNVAIEIKYNLSKPNEYHRTLGQMLTYVSAWNKETVLVLYGKNDLDMVKGVRRAAKKLAGWSGKKVRVVEKKS